MENHDSEDSFEAEMALEEAVATSEEIEEMVDAQGAAEIQAQMQAALQGLLPPELAAALAEGADGDGSGDDLSDAPSDEFGNSGSEDMDPDDHEWAAAAAEAVQLFQQHFQGVGAGADMGDAGDSEDGEEFGDDVGSDEEEALQAAALAAEVGLEREAMHCALREHDVRFLSGNVPRMHTGVAARTLHHQTADALVYVPSPPEWSFSATASGGVDGGAAAAAAGESTAAGSRGVEDVVVACGSRLALWRLGAVDEAIKLAETSTGFGVYSVTVSSDGSLVAACTATGALVAVFRLVRTPPPVETPGGGDGDIEAGVLPAAEQQQQHDDAGAGEQQQQAGVDQERRRKFQEQREQFERAEQRRSAQIARGDFGTARLEHYATLMCRSTRETMANCVRFGSFGGKERLLVAHQDGLVYILNLPPPASDDTRASEVTAVKAAISAGTLTAAPMLRLLESISSAVAVRGLPSWPTRASLDQPSPAVLPQVHGRPLSLDSSLLFTLQPAVMRSAKVRVLRAGPLEGQPALTRQMVHEAPRIDTCAISGLHLGPVEVLEAHPVEADGSEEIRVTARQPRAINTAQPSPDGRWLAIGRDDTRVVLVPAAEGYQNEQVRLLSMGVEISGDFLLGFEEGAVGVQYCAFNPSSTLLAASCDALWTVTVWSVPAGQLLFRFTSNMTAVLPIKFADDSTLIYSESEQSTVHIVDLRPTRLPDPHWNDKVEALAEFVTVRSNHREPGLDIHKGPLPHRAALHGPTPPGGARQRRRDVDQTQHQHRSGDGRGSRSGRNKATGSSGKDKEAWESDRLGEPPNEWCLEEVVQMWPPSSRGTWDADGFEDVAYRVHGMVVTPQGRVLVARQEDMWELSLLTAQPWSAAAHKRYPPKFQDAARLLLLAAHAGAGGAGGGGQFERLPASLVERILREAATPLVCWAKTALLDARVTVGGYSVFQGLPTTPWLELPRGIMHIE